MYPNEGYSRRGIDTRAVKVAGGAGDDTASQQSEDDSAGFHDRRAKTFANDDGNKDRKAETYILSAAPGKGMRVGVTWAELVRATAWTCKACAATSSPALEPGLDERNTDESDSGTGDERWEELFKVLRGGERQRNLEQRADASRTEDGTIAMRTGQLKAVCSGRAEACGVHLRQCPCSHRNDTEAGAHD